MDNRRPSGCFKSKTEMIHDKCPIDISWINPPTGPSYTDLVIGRDFSGNYRIIRAYFDNGKFAFGIEYEGERSIDFNEYRSKIIKEANQFYQYQAH